MMRRLRRSHPVETYNRVYGTILDIIHGREPQKQLSPDIYRLLSATQQRHLIRDDEVAVEIRQARRLEKRLVELLQQQASLLVQYQEELFDDFCQYSVLCVWLDILQGRPDDDDNAYCGIIWMTGCKVQVLSNFALLLSEWRDATCIYYLQSNHWLNVIVPTVLPLTKWIDLEAMVPFWIQFLQQWMWHLVASPPAMWPFYIVLHEDSNEEKKEDATTSFPLLTACLETVTSKYASTDAYTHATCLQLLGGLWNLMHDAAPYRASHQEQEQLIQHLCRLYVRQHEQWTRWTTGPVWDQRRHVALQKAETPVLDAFLPVIPIALGEAWVSRVVVPLLRTLETPCLLDVGLDDIDVIPHREAASQSALVYLTKCLPQFPPLERIVALVCWHPQTPVLRTDTEYPWTTSLHDLATCKTQGPENRLRAELIKALRGDYGEWRMCAACGWLERFLTILEEDKLRPLLQLETIQEALCNYLEKKIQAKYPLEMVALKKAGDILIRLSQLQSDTDKAIATLEQAHKRYAQQALSHSPSTMGEMMLDILQDALESCYRKDLDQSPSVQWVKRDCSKLVLVRGERQVCHEGDIGNCRFASEATIYLRGLLHKLKHGNLVEDKTISDLISDPPKEGSIIHILQGQMSFDCQIVDDDTKESLILVLHPAHLLLLSKQRLHQSLPLWRIVACGVDGCVLYIGHTKGTLGLQFVDKTSLVVQRYLERSRHLVRNNRLAAIRELLVVEEQ